VIPEIAESVASKEEEEKFDHHFDENIPQFEPSS